MFLSIVGCVLFVVCWDKGILPTFLGVCIGCATCSNGGFDQSCHLPKFGLENVGWNIELYWVAIITLVLSPIGGEAKSIGVFCPKVLRLGGIAQQYLSSKVYT